MSSNDDMVSVEEAFGRSWPGTTPPAPPDEPDDDDAGATGDEGGDEGDAGAQLEPDDTGEGGDEGDEGEGEPELEWVRRGFAADDFTERGWKTYRELETRFSQTRPVEPGAAPPAPDEPAKPPPAPLRPGGIAEIKTEEDLYGWAQVAPKDAAMFALEQRERLSDEQFETVMNNWFASNPTQYMQQVLSWNNEIIEERQREAQVNQDAHYLNQIRDIGIEQATAELPMISDYGPELADFMEANPHLNQWVEGLRTPDQVKSALHSIFYQMAGPKLAQQILEQQVQTSVEQREREAAQAAAEAEQSTNASKAQSTRRSTAPAPGTEEAYDDAIRDIVLNPSRRR